MPQNFLDWLQIADALALACLAVKLSFGGLFRAYTALFLHSLFALAAYVVTFTVPFTKFGYAVFYVAHLPFLWALWIAICVSLYRQTLAHYPSLLTLGRRVFIGALVTTVLFVIATVGAEVKGFTDTAWMRTVALAADRALALALALFVVALCAFLAWFLIPARRNTAYLCLAFGTVFAVNSAVALITNARGSEQNIAVNILGTTVTAGVFFACAATLNKEGEEQITFVARKPTARQVEDAVNRLGKFTKHLRG